MLGDYPWTTFATRLFFPSGFARNGLQVKKRATITQSIPARLLDCALQQGKLHSPDDAA
jgi:hypothetical protein